MREPRGTEKAGVVAAVTKRPTTGAWITSGRDDVRDVDIV
jgi:hypothetical protein